LTFSNGFGSLLIRPWAIFKSLSFNPSMDKISTFFKEVRVELAKVSWPTKNQTIVYTMVVIGISLFMALLLGLLDFIYKLIIDKFLIQ